MALKHSLEALKVAGAVIPRELAETALFESARHERDAWLNFPAKFGPLARWSATRRLYTAAHRPVARTASTVTPSPPSVNRVSPTASSWHATHLPERNTPRTQRARLWRESTLPFLTESWDLQYFPRLDLISYALT